MIAEGVATRVSYKAYASGTMTSNSQDQAPGASGAQTLRRTTANFSLSKSTYQSAEIRDDRQIADFRHGARTVTGSLQGEFSPQTYFELITAAHRDTAVASITKGASAFTSVVSSNTGTFTMTAGNPVTEGFRVGDVIRFTGLAATANNSKNFIITSFTGTQSRTIGVYPAPTTDAAPDTSFTITRPGKSTLIPSTGFVSRKFGIEVYHSDIDIARLTTEARITGYRLGLPAEGMSTIEVMATGRDQVVTSASSAPYFTSPTAATTTGIFAAVNGLLRVGGTAVGTITGVEFDGAAVAADNTDYDVITISRRDAADAYASATTIATYDTRAAGQGAISAFVPAAFALSAVAGVLNVLETTRYTITVAKNGAGKVLSGAFTINGQVL